MQLAQVNVAEAVAPLDSPALRGFVRLLDPLDALARAAPGFVWRPRPEELDQDELAAFGDPWWVVVNMSVWESVAALRAFTYGGAHGDAVRRRRQWFHRAGEPAAALWWVEDGERPTPAEAHRRLELLRREGPTAAAFTLQRVFEPRS
jgi:Domain of unknown function (DUF3291)